MSIPDQDALGQIHDQATLSLLTNSVNNDEVQFEEINDVKTTQGDDGDRIGKAEDRIALTVLRSQISEGWSVLNMIDGISDEYNDETGVDGAETTAIYNADLDMYEPGGGAVFLGHMDDTGLTDSSPNDLTTTLNGSVARSDAQSKFGGYSMASLGAGDSLSIADDPKLDWSGDVPWTFEAQIYLNSYNSPYSSVANKRTAGTNGWVMLLNNTGGAEFRVGGSSYLLSGTVPLATWTHIAFSYDGSTLRYFVNGVEAGSSAIATITNVATDLNLTTSIGPVSDDANCYMDEVRISDTAVYTSNFTPPAMAFPDSADNLILQSVQFAADESPTKGRIVMLHEPVGAIDLNVDVKAFVSRDDGATWEEATLEEADDFDETVKILTTGDIDLSGQPAGAQLKYKVETYNNKTQNFHGTWLQWR